MSTTGVPVPSPFRGALRFAALAFTATLAALLVGAASAYAAPANDNFTDAEILTGGAPTADGTNVGATWEDDEPDHTRSGHGHSAWYRWTAPSDGGFAVDLAGSNYDTVAAVYEGDALDELVEVGWSDDDPSGGLQSYAAFVAEAGESYMIAVDGYNGDETGLIELAIEEEEPADVSGTVTAASDGSPLEDMCVTLYSDDFGELDTAQTDADGEYSFENLVPTWYRLGFTDCGAGFYRTEYYDDQSGLFTSDVFRLYPADQFDADAQLEEAGPPGSISGHLTDSGTGGDAANVCVTASNADGGYASTVNTGPGGNFTIPNLPAADYKVEFATCDDDPFVSEYWEERYSFDDADRVTVAAGTDTPLPNVGIAPSGSISGTVTGPGNVPAEGICVRTDGIRTDGSGWSSPRVRTDADGEYSILHVPEGTTFTVEFEDCDGAHGFLREYYDGERNYGDADHIDVTAGADTGGIDARMEVENTISGRVTDLGDDPLFGFCINLYDEAGDPAGFAQTTSTGRYFLTDLWPGEYSVEATDCGWGTGFLSEFYDDAATLAEATPITLSGGTDFNSADFRLTGTGPGGITGTVTNELGDPLEDVCVSASSDGPGSYDASTDADGNYELTGVPAGEYTVAFTDCVWNEYDDQYYDGAEVEADADPVTVNAGTTTSGIDADLTAGGRITGRVTNAEGVALEDICVDVWDVEDEYPVYWGEIYTDEDGRYTAPMLEAGDYRVEFIDCDGVYNAEWYEDESSFETADDVTVLDGETTPDIDAELTRAGSISGTVTNEAGDPLGNVCVYVYGEDFQTAMFTEPDGSYELGGLPPWDGYQVEVTCTAPYGGEWYDNALTWQEGEELTVGVDEHLQDVDFVLQDTAPVNTAKPDIAGSPATGRTLVADRGAWEHEPSRYEYEWRRCTDVAAKCRPIAGADERTYTQQPADEGHRLRVIVTATNSVGSADAQSASTRPAGTPTNDVPPEISGVTLAGETLSATEGSWSGNPTSFAYAWQSCTPDLADCDPVGSDASTLELTGAENGRVIRVRVEASNGFAAGGATSEPTTVVGLPVNTTKPQISGVPRVGRTLTATDGDWLGAEGPPAFEWLRCLEGASKCRPIAGATDSTYSLAPEDLGYRLRVAVTELSAEGSAQALSASTRPIGAL